MQEPFQYFGSDLTIEQCEEIALLKVRPEYRMDESDLFLTKWFDYRHLHPVKATYLFTHEYRSRVREMYAKTRDVKKALTVKPIAQDDVFESVVWASMWRARQAYDRLGVRYGFGLAFTFNRCNDRGWGYFPRPNQLYGEELILDLRDAWKKHCRVILERVQHPRFTTDYYCGHPDQDHYQAWITDQCKVRAMPHMTLATLLRDKLVLEDVAVTRLGAEVVRKAKLLTA